MHTPAKLEVRAQKWLNTQMGEYVSNTINDKWKLWKYLGNQIKKMKMPIVIPHVSVKPLG